MKFLFTYVFFTLVFYHVGAQTYTWKINSTPTGWATPGNWTPARNTPTTSDILVFDGASTPTVIVNSIPDEAIGKLYIKNNANVILGVSADATLTIGNGAITAPHFQLDAGSTVSLNSVGNNLTLLLAAGSTAQIAGSLVFSGTSPQIISTTAGAIVFQNGSTFTTKTNFSGFPFGMSANNANTVVFQNGSHYIHETGGNPFNLPPPASMVIFQKGSLYTYRNSAIFSASGRTYPNFELDISGSLTIASGNTPMRCDTFIFKSGTNFNYNTPGGLIISGDLKNITTSGTINFTPTILNNSTILFDGAVNQNISGSVNFSSFATFAVASSSSVNLLTNISSPDSINVHGKLYMNDNTVAGNALNMYSDLGSYAATSGTSTLNTNTITNVAAPQNFRIGVKVNITGGGFPGNVYVTKIVGTTVHLSQYATVSGAVQLIPVYNSGTLGIGSANGISAAPSATGNVLTIIRNFQTRGNYEYTGSFIQNTGTGLPSSVKGLILNKSAAANVTLTASTNVDERLSLQKGFIVTTASSLPTLRDTTLILSPVNLYGFTNEGYESSFIRGPLKINATSIANKIAPIGKNTGFAPVRLGKINAGAVTYTLEYFDQPYAVTNTDTLPLHHVSAVEHWLISTDVAGPVVAAKLSLSWRPYSKVGDGIAANNAQALNDLVVAHYFDDGAGYKWLVDGADNTVMPKSPSATVSYGMVTTNIATGYYSPFTLGTKSPYNILPLNLLKFVSKAEGEKIKLIWEVSNEENTASYELQRSTDATAFTPVRYIKALRQVHSDYVVDDQNFSSGWNYYRLKIIDNKGKIFYSHTIRILRAEGVTISAYPNPATEKITIQLPPSGSVFDVEIVNYNGQTIRKLSTTERRLVTDVSRLAKGIYYIRIKNSSTNITQQFIIQ